MNIKKTYYDYGNDDDNNDNGENDDNDYNDDNDDNVVISSINVIMNDENDCDDDNDIINYNYDDEKEEVEKYNNATIIPNSQPFLKQRKPQRKPPPNQNFNVSKSSKNLGKDEKQTNIRPPQILKTTTQSQPKTHIETFNVTTTASATSEPEFSKRIRQPHNPYLTLEQSQPQKYYSYSTNPIERNFNKTTTSTTQNNFGNGYGSNSGYNSTPYDKIMSMINADITAKLNKQQQQQQQQQQRQKGTQWLNENNATTNNTTTLPITKPVIQVVPKTTIGRNVVNARQGQPTTQPYYETEEDPNIKNSYIYQKYFANNSSQQQTGPVVLKPTSMREYRQMVMKLAVDNYNRKVHLNNTKSKKLQLSTTNNAVFRPSGPAPIASNRIFKLLK